MSCYNHLISSVEDIERAVSDLGLDEFARFRAWFEAFDADRFDNRLAADARAGKLDGMAEAAIAEPRQGRARSL